MRGWFLVVLVGCASETQGTGGQRPTEPEREIGEAVQTHVVGECAHSAALYGMTGNAQATPIGPVTVDQTGIDLCLSLDARDNLVVAHFAAGTEYEMAASSSFLLALFDRDGNPMREGWDVSFGSTPTTTFANLEYGITKGQLVDVVLWVRAKSGTATSTVNLHLFEPYE